MPSPHERRRNNVKTGVFVSLTLILGVSVIVVLSDLWQVFTKSFEVYTVVYPVSSGVNNLQTGAGVRVGGIILGSVLDVRPDLEGQGPFKEIEVEFEIDERIRLYEGAIILVTAPLIGSDAWLDIIGVGDPSLGTPAILRGTESIGMLSALLGNENAGKMTSMVDDALEFTDFLATVPEEYEERVVPIIDDVRTVTKNLREDRWPHWADSVDQVMTWAVEFSGELDKAAEEGNGLLTDARAMVRDNRPQVDETIDNLTVASGNAREVVQVMKETTLPKVHEVLERGRQGMDRAVALIENLQVDYDVWSVDLGQTLANASLASQQLKLTTIEVRRSPWKLLYRPDATELEHELLYESARSFAVAAADLKAAADSAQRIMTNHRDLLQDDPELLERLTRNLVEPLQKYELAQQRLLDILFENGP